MPALTDGRRRIFVGYSTNVHRAETVPEIGDFLDRYTLPVMRALGLSRMGLDLRIGAALAAALAADHGLVARLRDALAARALHVFGVNAFPLGDFQAPRVKTAVYRPSWAEPERRERTVDVARALASLLPEGGSASVSTVAGGYRAFGDDPGTKTRMAEALVAAARDFAEISARSGRRLTLCPEPEPDTTMDDLASTIAFFRDHVAPAAERARADGAVRDHLRVTLDACHLSVAFEDPGAVVAALAAAGVAVGKANVSCCLAAAPDAPGRAFLEAMDEPRFLHQTWGADAAGRVVRKLRDLEDLRAASDGALAGVAELRSHFHVPLTLEGRPPFATTREETACFLEALVRGTDCADFAVETYTWTVLAATGLGSAVEDDLVAGLAGEIRWTLDRLAALGFRLVETDPWT